MNLKNNLSELPLSKNRYIANFLIWPVVFLMAFFVFHQNLLAQPESAIGAIGSVDESPIASGAAGKASQTNNAGASQKTPVKSKSKTKTKSKQTKSSAKTASKTIPAKPKPPKPYDGFIIGDKYTFLNFEIAEKVQPVHTIKAKDAGASGLVQVEVLIETDGTVLTAKARTGDKLLHPEAEKAALATKFNKPELYGKPVRATGFIVYRFGKSED